MDRQEEINTPLSTQIGGTHYKDMPIQPIEFISKNNIPFIEGNIIKYASRHKSKNGAQDIEKVIHYAALLLSLEYGYSSEQIKKILG